VGCNVLYVWGDENYKILIRISGRKVQVGHRYERNIKVVKIIGQIHEVDSCGSE
jgi:hypothetical protein